MSTSAQRYFPDAAPRRCRQTWIGLAKFPITLLLSRDGSDGYCDGCLEVRDGQGVVPIHPVLEVTPHSEVWRGSGLVSVVTILYFVLNFASTKPKGAHERMKQRLE